MRKALIVGIDNYPTSPLSGCVNDATIFESLISTNGDGSPNFDTILINDVCSKKELYQYIKELFQGQSDISLLYFAGHGTDEGNGYILTPDYNESMGISMDEILSLANKSSSKNKIIILDSCFSGNLGVSAATSGNESIIGEGVTIMTASRSDEVSMEINGHGVFTNLLIQGLRGGASDIRGNITPASLYSYIDQSLGSWQQRPIFKTNISQFLPIRKIQPKVPQNVLRKICKYFPNPTDEFKLDPSFEYTNTPNEEHIILEPYADELNVEVFKELQLYESVGLVEPVGTDHMYFAAMENKTCKLTALGYHYWRLARDKRF